MKFNQYLYFHLEDEEELRNYEEMKKKKNERNSVVDAFILW